MSTSIQPQQSTCPSWCTDHDDDTDGTTLAHQQHVATASGFDVRVNELLEVTDPSLEISGAHVRIIDPAGLSDSSGGQQRQRQLAGRFAGQVVVIGLGRQRPIGWLSVVVSPPHGG